MCHLSKKSTFPFTAIAVLSGVLLAFSLVRDLSAMSSNSGWRQSNISGFGTSQNSAISALANLGNQMYAGTWNDNGAQVWRTRDGQTWSQVTPTWSISNIEVQDAESFGTYLYVGTGREGGGEIWRTNGTTWEQVASGGLGDSNNYGFNAFAVFSNALYVATANIPPAIGGTGNGVEIWRSKTGNAGSWVQVNSDGFGAGPTWPDVTMEIYEGHLYVGLSRPVGKSGGIAELWRTDNGTTWTAVFTDGLGSPDNTHASAMAGFKGDFYIGLRNSTTGGEVWRSSDGMNWTAALTGGYVANSRPYGLIVFNDQLYLVFSNVDTGAEVWQTGDGVSWRQISAGGWGDSNNGFADYFDKGAVVFNQALYIGTVNNVDGGEIWQRLHQLYLPLVLKN